MAKAKAKKTITETTEKPPNLEKLKEGFQDLPPEERRKQYQWIKSRLPRMSNAQAADLFSVSEDTINQDRARLKQASVERLANDPELQAEIFAPYETARDGAFEDIERVTAEDPNRAAHRRTAIAAHEKLLDVMFRTGYLAEAPKRVELGSDPDKPVMVEQTTRLILTKAETLEAMTMMEEANGKGGEADESKVD